MEDQEVNASEEEESSLKQKKLALNANGRKSFFNQQNKPATGLNETDVNEKDFLLQENSSIDYEKVKNMYPLRDNNGQDAGSQPDRRVGYEPASA